MPKGYEAAIEFLVSLEIFPIKLLWDERFSIVEEPIKWPALNRPSAKF